MASSKELFQQHLEKAAGIERQGFTSRPHTVKFHTDMVNFHTKMAKSASSAKEMMLHHQYAKHHTNLLNKIKGL